MRTFHKAVYAVLRQIIILMCRIKFGYRFTKAAGLPQKYIVLANHTTDYDPFFVAASFPRQMYFVASEHIARWGFVSRIIRFLVDPILRSKGSVAVSTVKEVLRRVKEGSNVCLFAEGNRSWDGRTGEILLSTGKMVKKARCGLVTYRITGGYYASPRWAITLRRGPVQGAVAAVYTTKELETTTAKEINTIIVRDLAEDAAARQQAAPMRYRGKRLAEGMENLLFICPVCGAHDSLSSHEHTVRCSACGLEFGYDEYGRISGGISGSITALADAQQAQVAVDAAAGAVYTGAHGTLVTVANDAATPVDEGPVSLGPTQLTCGATQLELAHITDLDIHGKRGVVFTAAGVYYELKPSGNALKYKLLYREYMG